MGSVRRSHRLITRGGAAAVLVVVAAALAADPSAAATIAVDRSDDPALTTAPGCSLRQAVQAANTNTAVGGCTAGQTALDTIELRSASSVLSLSGATEDANASGDLDVLSGGQLRIVGTAARPSRIVQQIAGERVLHLLGGTLELDHVTITGGSVPAGDGGGIRLKSGATLTLTATTVTANTARSSGGIANGTRAANDPGGVVRIVRSTVSGNTSTANSGGSMGAAGIGTIGGTVTVVNSTVSGNLAGLGRGGGIYSEALLGQTSTVEIAASTITANTGSGANLNNAGNGGNARMTIRSTILSAPGSQTNCAFGGNGNSGFASLGFNISDDAGCLLSQPTDLPRTDPQLGQLADNGGPTLTHAPAATSPAIDRGTSDTAIAGFAIITTDQRGVPRPVDFPGIANPAGAGGADIGAVERQTLPTSPTSTTPSTSTPTTTSPTATKKDASVRVSIAAGSPRVDSKRRVRVKLSCPRTEASPPCRGTLTLRTRTSVTFRGRRRVVELAHATFRIAAGRSHTVVLKLGPSIAALVRGRAAARRVYAVAAVRDGAGNRATVRRSLALRPGR